MKMFFAIAYLLTINAIFASSASIKESGLLVGEESLCLFPNDLENCGMENVFDQPVYLRTGACEEELPQENISILDLELSCEMSACDIAERILYGNADVVHLDNISREVAADLYESLGSIYAHFLYVPYREKGIFVASKYSISQATVTVLEQETALSETLLEFALAGATPCCLHVSSNALSTEVVSCDAMDCKAAVHVLLADVPGILTAVKHNFSFPYSRTIRRHHERSVPIFKILPVKHKGGRDDDRGGYKAEVEIGRSWGGKDGGHWEGTGRFEAHDDRGNYFGGEVRQNDQGEGSANARAGHEEK